MTSASERSTCLPGRAPRTERSLSMITSTGSERRATPPPGAGAGVSAAGLSEGGAPPAASPLDVMVMVALVGFRREGLIP